MFLKSIKCEGVLTAVGIISRREATLSFSRFHPFSAGISFKGKNLLIEEKFFPSRVNSTLAVFRLSVNRNYLLL